MHRIPAVSDPNLACWIGEVTNKEVDCHTMITMTYEQTETRPYHCLDTAATYWRTLTAALFEGRLLYVNRKPTLVAQIVNDNHLLVGGMLVAQCCHNCYLCFWHRWVGGLSHSTRTPGNDTCCLGILPSFCFTPFFADLSCRQWCLHVWFLRVSVVPCFATWAYISNAIWAWVLVVIPM